MGSEGCEKMNPSSRMDNFVELPVVTATRTTVNRVVTVNTTDAKSSPISYTVTTELKLTRVAP